LWMKIKIFAPKNGIKYIQIAPNNT